MMEIDGDKDSKKGTHGYYFYVRATQSVIHDKVLSLAGGVLDSRARQPREHSRPPPGQVTSSGSGGYPKGRGSGKKGRSRASSRK
jgi:hypothetical protein